MCITKQKKHYLSKCTVTKLLNLPPKKKDPDIKDIRANITEIKKLIIQLFLFRQLLPSFLQQPSLLQASLFLQKPVQQH